MSYKFSCGCEFEVENETIKEYDGLPSIKIDYYNLPLNCKKTWNLIGSGRTRGVFQLESNLGRSYSKKLEPDSMALLAALISVLRPGCISGETLISIGWINTDGRRYFKKIKLKDIHEKFKNNPNQPKFALSYNEENGKLEKNRILNTIYSGVKKVYRVLLKKRNRGVEEKRVLTNILECTDDHKLLTLDGWKPLSELKIGDKFAVAKRIGGAVAKKHIKGRSSFRDVCFKHYQYKCIFCDWNDGSLDVNHIEDNRFKNNHYTNLCYMCPNHHRMYSENTINKEQTIEAQKKHLLPIKDDIQWATYVGKEFIGEMDVYDISMEGPHHNFIAGDTVVHNCMNAMLNDKSMTNHFVDRKHGREPVTYIHPSLEKYLSETFGIIVYQEQAISIAKGIAGFTPEEANALRKAIGKKKADLLAKLRDIFIEGCIRVSQFDRSVATELFDNIEAANRYSFNASHAYTYSYISYATAYAKAHFPLHFFTSALKFIKDNDELRDLMSEVAVFDLQVLGPSISNLLPRFNIKDGFIQYGLAEVKKSGEKEILSFIEYVVAAEKSINKEVKDFTWYEFLILLSDKIKRDALMNLIMCGLLDNTGISRKTQLHEFGIYDELSDGERKWVSENWQWCNSLEDLLIRLLQSDKPTKKRKSKVESLLKALQNPGRTLQDNVEFVCDSETEAMGISVSMNRTVNKERFANIKCLDFLLGSGNKNMMFVVEVKDVEERVIKTGANEGKKMANVKLADRSGEMECTIFSKEWMERKADVVKGNVLLLRASRHQDNSLRVEDVRVL